MSISHINDLQSGVSVRGTLNDTIDQVNTNTTDVATNTAAIALKQNANAANTTILQIDTSQTTNYTWQATDNNKYFVILNAADSNFVIPLAFPILIGSKVTITNHESSIGNVVIAPAGGVAVRPSSLLTIAAGSTQTIVKLAANTYRTYVG